MVTLHFFENLFAQGDLLAVDIVHGLPFFFAEMHRVDVLEVGLVELKNSFKSINFTLVNMVGLWLLFGRLHIMDLAVAIAVLDILGPGIVIFSFFLSLEVNELCFLIVAMFDNFDLGAI